MIWIYIFGWTPWDGDGGRERERERECVCDIYIYIRIFIYTSSKCMSMWFLTWTALCISLRIPSQSGSSPLSFFRVKNLAKVSTRISIWTACLCGLFQISSFSSSKTVMPWYGLHNSSCSFFFMIRIFHHPLPIYDCSNVCVFPFGVLNAELLFNLHIFCQVLMGQFGLYLPWIF